MNKMCVIAAAFTALSAGGALAQTDYISQLDTNRDGAISRAEFETMSRDHFQRQDLNRDGRLGAEEPHYGPPDMSADDYVAQAFQTFDGADANHDGALIGDEVAALRSTVASAPPRTAAGR